MAVPSNAIKSQQTRIDGIVAATRSVAFDSGAKTITATVGSWIADGFVVGMDITTSDGTNASVGKVTGVTALVLTVNGTVATVAAASKTVTGAAKIGEVKSFNGPGGQASEIDVTTLESTAKEFLMGLQDEGEISMEVNFDPADVGQVFCRNARANQTRNSYRITLPNAAATKLDFLAFCKGFSLAGGVDDVVKASLTLRVTGAVTYT
jgi:hypothetical protein